MHAIAVQRRILTRSETKCFPSVPRCELCYGKLCKAIFWIAYLEYTLQNSCGKRKRGGKEPCFIATFKFHEKIVMYKLVRLVQRGGVTTGRYAARKIWKPNACKNCVNGVSWREREREKLRESRSGYLHGIH